MAYRWLVIGDWWLVGEDCWIIKKKTVAAVSRASSINQIENGKSNVFCMRIPAIRPTAANKRGQVLMICLWIFLPASCLSNSSNFRWISSIAEQTTGSRPKTQEQRLKTQNSRPKTQDQRLKTQDPGLKTQDQFCRRGQKRTHRIFNQKCEV